MRLWGPAQPIYFSFVSATKIFALEIIIVYQDSIFNYFGGFYSLIWNKELIVTQRKDFYSQIFMCLFLPHGSVMHLKQILKHPIFASAYGILRLPNVLLMTVTFSKLTSAWSIWTKGLWRRKSFIACLTFIIQIYSNACVFVDYWYFADNNQPTTSTFLHIKAHNVEKELRKWERWDLKVRLKDVK